MAVPGAVRLLDAVGFDIVIVETVGVGQIEVDVAGAADTTIVIVTPGWGDAIQANKAGLLEVADVFVVNKADRAGAADARRDLDYMLDLGGQHHGWRPPIVCTIATEGSGIDELLVAADDHRRQLHDTGELELRRQRRARAEIRSFLARAASVHVDKLMADHAALLADVDGRRVAPARAAEVLARAMWGNINSGAPD